MNQTGFFKECWALPLLLGILLLLAGCRASRSGMMPNPPDIAEAEARLIRATEQMLALPADADAETRQKYRELFEAALAEYLIATRGSEPANLEFTRDGKRYVLPVQIIASNRLTDPTRLDTMVIQGDAVSGGFRGEILDFAWLPTEKEKQLLMLFADSLVVFPWGQQPDPNISVYRFPAEKKRPIRSVYPLGIFAVGSFDADPHPEISVLTSSLQQGLVLEYRAGTWQLEPTAAFPDHPFLPTQWSIPSGKNEFRPIAGQNPLNRPLRSFRMLGDGQIVTLDDAGMLALLEPAEFREVWRSQRPWGSRLFVMDSLRVGIANEEQPAFVIFEYRNQILTPTALTRNFSGRVSAVIGAEQRTEKGYLVSVVDTAPDGTSRSRLTFVGATRAGERSPDRFPRPRFPNEYAELSVVEEAHRRIGDFSPEVPPNVAGNVYECLYKISGEGSAVPLLVEKVTADSLFQRWRITLRRDIRFSDGTLLTAREVIQSWQQLWREDPLSRTTLRWLWQDIRDAGDYADGRRSDIRGLQAPDDHTLLVELTGPRPEFPEHLAQWCFAVRRITRNAAAPLGTGPFRITKMENNRITCERNVSYHGGRPLLAKIHFTQLNSNIADALLNRRLPVAMVQERKDVDFFRRVYNRRLQRFPQKAIYFLAMNPQSPALSSRSARMGIAATLDRKVQADIITEGRCETANTLAGASKGFVARGNVPAGSGAPLQIIYRQTDGVARQIAERLTARLGQMNIANAAPRPVEDPVFAALRKSGEYDILVDAYVPAFGAPLYNLGQLIHRGYVVPPTVQQALYQALAAPSAEAAAALEMQLMNQHAVLYPLVQLQRYAALPPDLQGVRLTGFSEIDFAKAWRPQ